MAEIDVIAWKESSRFVSVDAVLAYLDRFGEAESRTVEPDKTAGQQQAPDLWESGDTANLDPDRLSVATSTEIEQ